MDLQRVQVVDSHTAGEPTRVVVAGGPDLGGGSMAERLQRFRRDHDTFRSAVVNEPRGSDVLVGALLQEPVDAAASAGVLFFNNVGMLGMCGHGTIGLVRTLQFLGRIGPGEHRIETPVGTVEAELMDDGRVSVRNVPAYRLRKSVQVDVPGHGRVTGDVAWGGNWFFLTEGHGQQVEPANIEVLSAYAQALRVALAGAGVTGTGGAEIDHIELFAPASSPELADSRSFVLCPGGAYDRSPCGTGTSAKLACLHADGHLRPGTTWRQESVIGSRFEARYELDDDDRVVPTITGEAFVTAEATLLFDPRDPFRRGIR
jgi:4-hydroxyproline epimerase